MSSHAYRWAKRRYLPFVREERERRRKWLRANRWAIRLNALRERRFMVLNVVEHIVWLTRRIFR